MKKHQKREYERVVIEIFTFCESVIFSSDNAYKEEDNFVELPKDNF